MANWILYILCAILLIIPPLFFIELKEDEWRKGFIPIRMVNAELKFCVFIITTSILIGIVWIRSHLLRQFKSLDKRIYFFGSIFFISICYPHFLHIILNAFVYSLAWHLLPILFAFSLFQFEWTVNKINGIMIFLLLGGLLSSW